MGMEDFQFLLGDLATAFREDATWGSATIPGRFRIDPFEASLGGLEPGLGETQIWFYCDRAIVPSPWPMLGDQLIIRGQVYEIVQKDEDDLGELGFRLIRQEIGISNVTSEGGYGDQPTVEPFAKPNGKYADPIPPLVRSALGVPVVSAETAARLAGRPSRRGEIEASFRSAVASGALDPKRPLKELCAVMHHRLGNGGGLSNRTLRRVVSSLQREHRTRVP
jgi:hypothetical protein